MSRAENTNYYAVLGLESKNRDSYSKDDIARARRTQLGKCHVDRNNNPEAKDLYETIAKAGDVLRDDDKRKEFDAKLMAYPEIYQPTTHLLAKLSGDPKAFDFNELALSDREYARKSFLATAGKNDEFREQLINNVALFFMFSIRERFELIFIDHRSRMWRKHAKPYVTVLFTLSELASNVGNYEHDFVLACIKHQESAQFFLNDEPLAKFSGQSCLI